ncbi:MAG: phosphotransferase [Deltaproteobacteria bacterium]|nr:phosphotransferase [Deltaproteobacteria bacterium]MBN2672522.1 phosphotransferase [Deltaproteobacteria bacterium]
MTPQSKVQQFVDRIFEQPTPIQNRTEMEKGASSRRYFRIELAGDAPSLVQMVLPEDSLKSDEAFGGAPPDELPFINVQRHLAAANLPVPRVFLDATDEGHLFLEDLGEITFNANLQGKSSDRVEAWYYAAVDLLAQMHNAMWPVDNTCLASKRFFDFELLRWELDHYREWGLEKRNGVLLDTLTRQTLDRIFDRFAEEIDALPKGFVHRDYQSRNLMVLADEPHPENLSIIDFQDALIGPRTYDLVALLNDSYVDLSAEVQERLIQRYAQKRALPYAEIRHEFDLITIQRKLKDGGRFVFIDQVKGDPSFLPFVDKSFSRVRSALTRIDGHEELKAILQQVDPDRFRI